MQTHIHPYRQRRNNFRTYLHTHRNTTEKNRNNEKLFCCPMPTIYKYMVGKSLYGKLYGFFSHSSPNQKRLLDMNRMFIKPHMHHCKQKFSKTFRRANLWQQPEGPIMRPNPSKKDKFHIKTFCFFFQKSSKERIIIKFIKIYWLQCSLENHNLKKNIEKPIRTRFLFKLGVCVWPNWRIFVKSWRVSTAT